MRKLLLSFLVVTTGAFSVMAQDGRKWSLQECVEHALENNLAIERSLLQVESTNLIKEQNLYSMLPNLNAGGSYGNSWGRTIDPTTNLFTTERVANNGVSASSSVLLFQTSRLRNTYKQSKLDLEASKLDLEATKDQVALNVITFYINVVFNSELLRNAESQLNSTQNLLRRTEIQVNAGALPITQLYDLKAQLATNEVSLINAQNAFNLAVLQLKQSLQIPADQQFDIITPVIDLEDQPLEGLTVGDIYAIAVGEMPGIRSADLGVESADLGVRIARAFMYPSLRLNGNLSTSYSSVRDGERQVPNGQTTTLPAIPIGTVNLDPNQIVFTNPQTVPATDTFENYPIADQWGDNFGRSVSVTLSIPIFNGLSATSGVQQSQIGLRQAEIFSEEQRNNLRQTIELAYNDVQAARKFYDQSLLQVDAQQESFRVTQRSYELGAMNFVDFQVSQNNLFQARNNLLLAKFDYIFKLKVLDFYQGKPLEF